MIMTRISGWDDYKTFKALCEVEKSGIICVDHQYGLILVQAGCNLPGNFVTLGGDV